jgi:hypothetical protein
LNATDDVQQGMKGKDLDEDDDEVEKDEGIVS